MTSAVPLRSAESPTGRWQDQIERAKSEAAERGDFYRAEELHTCSILIHPVPVKSIEIHGQPLHPGIMRCGRMKEMVGQALELHVPTSQALDANTGIPALQWDISGMLF